MTAVQERTVAGLPLVQQFERGLDAPICLTWELTYACNLECAHCLSSSGRRDPRELTTTQCEAVIDELQRMQVFYVNIGGGEPTIRPDFWHLLQYAVDHRVGVKFSTNGARVTANRAAFLASTDYVDVQVSLDGATAEINDYVRGPGSFDTAVQALEHLQAAGFSDAKISVVCTWHNIGQLDDFKASLTATARRCGSPGCGRRAGGPTCGTTFIHCRSSRRGSTTGSSPTATVS